MIVLLSALLFSLEPPCVIIYAFHNFDSLLRVKSVNSFQVLDHFRFSDHNPILSRLKTNLNIDNSLNIHTDDPNVLVYNSMYPKKREYAN